MFTLTFVDVFALFSYNLNLDMFMLFFLDVNFFLIPSYAPINADVGNANKIPCVLSWDWLALMSKEIVKSIRSLSSSRSKLRN